MASSHFIISKETNYVFTTLSLLHKFDASLFNIICPDGEPTTEEEKNNLSKTQKLIDELNEICNQFLLKSVNSNIQSAYDIV